MPRTSSHIPTNSAHNFGSDVLLKPPHRFGFNGKESDSEVKGEGNQQDYGMRVYDNRLGRFLSVDPIAKAYPELTPYQFASNRPIKAIDFDGLEAWDGPKDARDVFTIEGYIEFVLSMVKVLTSEDNQMKFNCADLPLYIWAKYHEHMKAEMKYTIPGTKQEISSNDKRFSTFDDFYKGLVQSNGKRSGGLRDNVGSYTLMEPKYGIAVPISKDQVNTGDVWSYSGHAMLNIPIDESAYHYSPLMKYNVIQAQPSDYDESEHYYGDKPYTQHYQILKNSWFRWRTFENLTVTPMAKKDVGQVQLPETDSEPKTR
jgi:RHS repeat-associated protein